jgi:hypothetical protein
MEVDISQYETTESRSVRQVIVKGDYIVMSRSLHRLNRKFNDILTKHLYSRKEELGRHPRRESSNKRVTVTSRSGIPKRPSLSNTSQKEVDRSRNNNDSKGTHINV